MTILLELESKWRERADQLRADHWFTAAKTADTCADDLKAALADMESWVPNVQQVRRWRERHGLDGRLTETEAVSAIDDARSMKAGAP